MPYIDGFVIACAEADKAKFIEHARVTDAMFIEMGALRVVECWGDDVSEGKLTDFRMAVKAAPGEAVVFSWIEWPDKQTRDIGFARIMDPANPDPRMDPTHNPVPFDGKRMIFGGFAPVFEVAA